MRVPLRTVAWLSLASVLGCTLGAGCDGSDDRCTRKGCYDQFVISFVQDDAWPEGEYLIEVSVDGDDTLECTFVFPFPSNSPQVCPDDSNLVFWAYRETENDPFEPNGLVVLGEPDEVSISVSVEGELLASDTFDVGDERLFPNGPDCDAGCLDEAADLEFGGGNGGAGGADG